MFYREAGQFKTSYGQDQAVFPIIQDRWFIALVLIVAFAVVPFVANEYWLQAVIIPFLIFSLAAIGLNLLTGYAGQLSLGTGAFMAVGAYATYKITTAFPGIDIFVVYLMSGMVAAGVGPVPLSSIKETRTYSNDSDISGRAASIPMMRKNAANRSRFTAAAFSTGFWRAWVLIGRSSIRGWR